MIPNLNIIFGKDEINKFNKLIDEHISNGNSQLTLMRNGTTLEQKRLNVFMRMCHDISDKPKNPQMINYLVAINGVKVTRKHN